METCKSVVLTVQLLRTALMMAHCWSSTTWKIVKYLRQQHSKPQELFQEPNDVI